MRLLVSGCSFSSGFGFDKNNIDKNWPNRLCNQLNATLTNVSVTGYDNSGIFLNCIEQITKENFDICLIQVTAIDRIVLSPNWHGSRLCDRENISDGLLSDHEYKEWYKKFVLLNQLAEHWTRLIKIIHTVQNLVEKGHYIRFVNGLLDWDQELFTDPEHSKFLNRLIDINHIADSNIDRLRQLVYNQTKTIDLGLWINPFKSFESMQIDTVAPGDCHPGPKSHEIYSDLVFNYLKGSTNA